MEVSQISKVLVIGLDGATWELLMPLAKEGFLPILGKLIDSGSYGELESTIPPITGPAWASFATGKNPGKTGIYDFLLPRNSLDDLATITSKDICGKTFYEILDDNDKRTIMVNLPVSYPPRTGGPTITSILTQGNQFIFPASLREKIAELEKYRIIPNLDLKVQGMTDDYIQDIRELEENRFRCAQKLFEWEWDFFFLLFSGTDWIQHELYDKLISNDLEKDHVAFQFFHDVDSYIGWFLAHLPSEASLLLMSDHGFRVYKGTFRVNQWLKQNNFLEAHYTRTRIGLHHKHHLFAEGQAKAESKKSDRERSRKTPRLTLPNFLIAGLQRLGFRRIWEILEKYDPSLRIKTVVNYARTRALCTTFESLGIYLNLTERFPNGIIEPQDASILKEEIISGLRRLKDPITGQDAFEKVLGNEEVYSGERVKFAPDILILPGNFWAIPGLLSSDNKTNLYDEGRIPFHSLNGIFLACGPGIKKGHEIHGSKIYDVAPTILHIFGIPIPRDMDGGVLKEIFESDSEFAGRPIIYTRADEKEQITRKIRNLKKLKGI